MCEKDNFLDIEQLPQTAIQCQEIIIGSYKCFPREKVAISHSGVRFYVPLIEDDTRFATVDVEYKDIVKLLFEQTVPVLFFYMSRSTGIKIRELLQMQDLNGPYYDPIGKDPIHKRITLLPNMLSEDSQAILISLFSREDKLVELKPYEANNILKWILPKNSLITTQKLNRNLANTTSVNDDIQIITVYPPPPAKGGIAINTEHYLCLAKDQFLNDVIIDFYLKYLTLEILSEFDQCRTHVFNSFFYKRLTSSYAQDDQSTVSMTPAAKRYARVQKWTKNVNIFEKDFIIIPINKSAHWFLAIICFPGLVGKISTCASKNDSDETVQKSEEIKELKTRTVTFNFATITESITITIDNESERDKAEKNKTSTIIKLEEQKEIIKSPCILIFDSLAGTSRSQIIAKLRDYLSCEYVAKFGVEKTFSKNTIKEAYPEVPQQSNSTDCGLYVLQYVESFFKDPIKDYNLPIKTLKSWFEERVVTRKREEISNLLVKLMNNTKGDKTINMPIVTFPTQDGELKLKIKKRRI